MTPSVASVQRLAFFSLRIPDSGLGCDVGSARGPIKRGVVRPRSVTFSSSSMHNRDEILVAKGNRRPETRMRFSVKCAFPHLRKRRATSRKSALCPSHLTENRTLQLAPHGKAHSAPVPRSRRDQKAHSGPAASPKTALWSSHLTENRTLAQTAQGASRKSAVWSVRGSQNAPFREDPCPECAFP